MTRLSIVSFAIVALLVTAGCMGVPLADSSGDQSSSSTPTAEPTTVPTATYPDPPDDLTNETAKQVAVAYEEARLQNQLRNESEITYFELGYVKPVNVTVLNRSDGGLYVAVDGAYSYGTPEKSADGVPVRSLYYVNEATIRHVVERD
ncbi:hypothetical protein [Halobacterium zhouii]|uniref:hypothetical protein n=1 Tax=Halobacterium zhouii TaxID=2902624 RepID=UPI001E655714|nr:hypothetical protein [Halobacterium zhouii]